MGNLPLPHMTNCAVYLDFMHLLHNFGLPVTYRLSRFVLVFRMKKKANSETVLKTLVEECEQVYGLPKVIHSDEDVRLTAAGNWYRGVLETLGCEMQFGTPYLRTEPPTLQETNQVVQNRDVDPHGAGEGKKLAESATAPRLLCTPILPSYLPFSHNAT